MPLTAPDQRVASHIVIFPNRFSISNCVSHSATAFNYTNRCPKRQLFASLTFRMSAHHKPSNASAQITCRRRRRVKHCKRMFSRFQASGALVFNAELACVNETIASSYMRRRPCRPVRHTSRVLAALQGAKQHILTDLSRPSPYNSGEKKIGPKTDPMGRVGIEPTT